MANVGIEISDVGVLAAGRSPAGLMRVDGDRSESPGIVLQQKKKLLVGWAAKRQDRLYPRQATNRFWSLLSMEPLQERALDAQNYAELAYAHLQAVAQLIPVPEPRWVVAVPEFLDQGQLGILLGVAKALGVPIEGFVANAVAAAHPEDGDRPILHVDVHLHRVELTRLERDDRIQRKQTALITDSGWERLEDQIAHRIANEFVQSTRFDPLQEAASEQALYDQLPALLETTTGGQPVPLALKLGQSSYRIAVPFRLVEEVCSPLCAKVVEALAGLRGDGDVAVQVSHRAARVPGLVKAIEGIAGTGVRVLEAGAGATGALAMHQEFRDESGAGGVNFLSSKAARVRSASPSPAPSSAPPPLPAAESPPPTHVLLDGQAVPLSDGPWHLVETPDGPALTPEPDLGDRSSLGVIRLEEGRAVVEPAGLAVQLIHVHPSRET